MGRPFVRSPGISATAPNRTTAVMAHTRRGSGRPARPLAPQPVCRDVDAGRPVGCAARRSTARRHPRKPRQRRSTDGGRPAGQAKATKVRVATVPTAHPARPAPGPCRRRSPWPARPSRRWGTAGPQARRQHHEQRARDAERTHRPRPRLEFSSLTSRQSNPITTVQAEAKIGGAAPRQAAASRRVRSS